VIRTFPSRSDSKGLRFRLIKIIYFFHWKINRNAKTKETKRLKQKTKIAENFLRIFFTLFLQLVPGTSTKNLTCLQVHGYVVVIKRVSNPYGLTSNMVELYSKKIIYCLYEKIREMVLMIMVIREMIMRIVFGFLVIK
jgi:hypothetical protein